MKKRVTYSRAALLLLFGLLVSATAFPQALKVSGTLKSNTGETLPGVNVVVRGTTNGVLSGTDGSYTLDNVSPNAVIVYSFIGYRTEEVSVNSRTVIDMVLSEDVQGLRKWL
ncbi:MAG: hypothetical protein E4G92_00245 [Bacteroidia bacterium]|nr:MAG: hypothetical protein E4G92_00245 [Bacteroidia bacterium]